MYPLRLVVFLTKIANYGSFSIDKVWQKKLYFICMDILKNGGNTYAEEDSCSYRLLRYNGLGRF